MYSPVTARAIVGALPSLLVGAEAPRRRVEAALAGRYGADRALLTGSGTAALVLAMRAAVPPGGVVALPAYGCIDLVAAAVRAEVRVRLYDLDPATLSPDLDSVQHALVAGADAVVVAHLYGYAADVPGVAAAAAPFGATVIEDAAQAAGGMLGGRALGSFGPLTVLSFGRGKGTTAGRGGALLATGQHATQQLERASGAVRSPARGAGSLVVAGAQLVFGTPALYGIPAAIPGLRLGEMVYHPAGEPDAMPASSVVLLDHALRRVPLELQRRQRQAARLLGGAVEAGISMIHPIRTSMPGYLRLPVRARRLPAPGLGILRGYPRTLAEMAELQPLLVAPVSAMPGAFDLRERLLTLPTHSRVSEADIERLVDWLQGAPPRSPAGGRTAVRQREVHAISRGGAHV